MKAMILAAGLGTRLRPLTNNLPKALVPLKEKPLLHHAIDYVSSYGFDEIIVNVHHFADLIKDFVKKQHFDKRVTITISDETAKLLDTGGGLKAASWFFDDDKPFLVYNSDLLTKLDLQDFYRYHVEHNPLATLAVRSKHSDRYLLFDENMNMRGLGNKKSGYSEKFNDWKGTGTEYGFSGIHMINPQIFEYAPEEDVFSIFKWYKKACRHKSIKGYDHSGTFWMDLGKPENLAAAEGIYDRVFK